MHVQNYRKRSSRVQFQALTRIIMLALLFCDLTFVVLLTFLFAKRFRLVYLIYSKIYYQYNAKGYQDTDKVRLVYEEYLSIFRNNIAISYRKIGYRDYSIYL